LHAWNHVGFDKIIAAECKITVVKPYWVWQNHDGRVILFKLQSVAFAKSRWFTLILLNYFGIAVNMWESRWLAVILQKLLFVASESPWFWYTHRDTKHMLSKFKHTQLECLSCYVFALWFFNKLVRFVWWHDNSFGLHFCFYHSGWLSPASTSVSTISK
jgi:hypothetical protein